MPHHVKMQLVYILVSVIPLVVVLCGGRRMRDTTRYPALRRYAWTGAIVTTILAAIDLVPYWLLGRDWPRGFWIPKNLVMGAVWLWLLVCYSRLFSDSSQRPAS